jgi:hypothetical protein
MFWDTLRNAAVAVEVDGAVDAEGVDAEGVLAAALAGVREEDDERKVASQHIFASTYFRLSNSFRFR